MFEPRAPDHALTINEPLPPRSHRVPWWKDALGEPTCPYIYRYVLDLRLFGLRLHHWISDDDQRAHHDHPWPFWTIVLKGSYEDVSWGPDGEERIDTLRPGSIRFRPAEWQHTVRTKGCWSFVITGRRIRAFGFWVPRRLDGVRRFVKANKFFSAYGHPPCAD